MSGGTDVEQREVRLALVMTGGVSLAVWMGGVAAELYRAVQRQGFYGRLLDATRTALAIDVISGSSAGGLNGAFLGTALARGADPSKFDHVRDLWLEAGAFTSLLRNPWAPNPPSLLQGDDYFLVRLRDALRDWRPGPAPNMASEPTVVLTCSLLSPDHRVYRDDFGTQIDEPIHAGLFTFTAGQLADGGITDRLALAARTSASFPGAFEPSFVPIGESPRRRPDMAGVADFTRSRWAVDGGVLLNKPVGPALREIAKRSSDREVRRVLAYVNPDPGGPVEETVEKLDDGPPGLGSVVIDSLVTLPRAETIASDLDQIAAHNSRTRRQRDTRVLLCEQYASEPTDPTSPAAQPDDVPLVALADDLYPMWLRKRTEWSIDRRLAPHFGSGRPERPDRVATPDGRRTLSYTELRDAMIHVRADVGWGASELPSAADLAGADDAGSGEGLADDAGAPPMSWQFGFHPLEYMCSVALDLIRRTYALLPTAAVPQSPVHQAREDLGRCRSAVHARRQWIHALRVSDANYWSDGLAAAATESESPPCAVDVARDLHAGWLRPLRPIGRPPTAKTDGDPLETTLAPAERERRWAWYATWRLARGADVGEPPPSPEDGLRAASELDLAFGGLADGVRRGEMRLAMALAATLRELAGPISTALAVQEDLWSDADKAPPKAEPDEDECETVPPVRLDGELRVLEAGLALGADSPTVLRRLLALYVVHMTTEDGFADEELRIELLQVSANTTSPLDTDRKPADKLAGLQLGHFGAFLKESWRANDWMWGTLDGAANLVTLLVEPARLRQVYGSSAAAVGALEEVVCPPANDPDHEVADWMASQVWTADVVKGITGELGFLDHPTDPPPPQLPLTTKALTEALQLQLARRELPKVADAVARTTRDGGGEPRATSEFVGKVRAAVAQSAPAPLALGAVRPLLQACAVGRERAVDELGSDAGASLAARAAAVATGVVSGSRSGLGPFRRAAQPFRTAALGIHLLAQSAATRSRAGFMATTVLLAVGAGAVAARLLGGGVSNAVLVVALALLGAWVLFTGFAVNLRLVSGFVALLIGVLAVSYIEPDRVCPVISGDCGPGQPQPEWKDPLHAIVPAVLLLAAAVLVVVALWRRLHGRPGGRERLIGSAVLAGAAALYAFLLHDQLFDRDAGSAAVDVVSWLSRNRALTTIVLLPAAFILLGYARVVVLELKAKLAQQRAAQGWQSP